MWMIMNGILWKHLFHISQTYRNSLVQWLTPWDGFDLPASTQASKSDRIAWNEERFKKVHQVQNHQRNDFLREAEMTQD